jgi:hypothetical protein
MNLKDLKTLIREEMRTVIREELKDILTEAVIIASKPESKPQGLQRNQPYIPIKGNYKSQIKEVINTPSTGNPLLDLLTETAEEGSWKSINGDGYNAQDAVSWAGGMPGMEGHTPVIASAAEMISNTAQANKYVSNLEDVRIDSVPDFSGIMSKMKENGSI